MASSYQALTREIEALKKKAEAARKQEAAELVALIKSAIALYGLTAQDLGLAPGGKPAKKAATAKKSETASKGVGAGRKAGKSARKVTAKTSKAAPADSATETSKPASTVKYKDDTGNAWSGRGPKPGWLRSALESGKSLEDFLA